MEKIASKVKTLRDEMYNNCIVGIKGFMKERGKQKNHFIETLSFDISDFEVEIDGQGTIDEITYIPSKDELGFVIYRYDSPSEVFMSRDFKRGDVDLVYRIFNILYKFYYLK